MGTISIRNWHGLISVFVVLLFFGSIGFLFNFNITEIPELIDGLPKIDTRENDFVNYSFEGADCNAQTRARAVQTKIPGYLELWDNYNSKTHDGVYGDGDTGDNYRFYLDTVYSYFSIYLHNIYNGDHLEYVNTTLQTASGVTSIISITDMYYNWSYMAGSGYGSVREFTYGFKTTSNAKITTYPLVLDIEFVTVDISNNKVKRTGRITLEVQLSSRIRTTDDELILTGRDKWKNTVPIYSGAKNQLIELRDAYSGDGDLTDLTLNIKPNFNVFTIDNSRIILGEFTTSSYYNEDLVWLLNDAGPVDKAADRYYGSMDISYEKDGISINEQTVPVALEIAKTPIINLEGQLAQSEIGSKSGSGDDYLSNVEIYQGSTTKTFSLKFTNDGNQKLKSVLVELYTDSAAYFFKSKFYYDESDYAYKTSYGKEIELGELGVGDSKTADISTEIVKNLPPGLYKIPIRYTIKYSESDFVDVELEEYEIHDDIIAARSNTGERYTPFFVIYVLPGDNEFDTAEPDITAVTENILRPGMHNVKLSVELLNMEYYKLNNVNVEITGGGASPLQPPNVLDRNDVQISSLEKEFTIYSVDDPVFSNKYSVTFMVDVHKDAVSGINEVPITLTCLDPFNQARTVKIKLQLNINPMPPKIILIDASTGKIEPDDTFNLKITVYNSGGSDASNVKLLFNGSSNMFTADKSVQGPKNINKGAEAEFEYRIKAGDVDPGDTYNPSVLVEFEDDQGNLMTFNDNPEQFISLRIDKSEPEPTWTINVGIALVVLGLLILISTIIFGLLRSRPRQKRLEGEQSKTTAAVDQREPRVKGPRPNLGIKESDRNKRKMDKRMKKDVEVLEPEQHSVHVPRSQTASQEMSGIADWSSGSQREQTQTPRTAPRGKFGGPMGKGQQGYYDQNQQGTYQPPYGPPAQQATTNTPGPTAQQGKRQQYYY